MTKNAFLAFFENFDQKIAFFLARAPHSKLVYIGAQGAFKNILGPVTNMDISK